MLLGRLAQLFCIALGIQNRHINQCQPPNMNHNLLKRVYDESVVPLHKTDNYFVLLSHWLMGLFS
jgi:hypothetical protein